jgi:hypothetical protein
MISRNETIPEHLTDQALCNIVNKGPAGGMFRALTLLGVRPEYRQGVEIRIYELRFRTVYHQSGLSDKIHTGVSESDAYKQALSELAGQLADGVV